MTAQRQVTQVSVISEECKNPKRLVLPTEGYRMILIEEILKMARISQKGLINACLSLENLPTCFRNYFRNEMAVFHLAPIVTGIPKRR